MINNIIRMPSKFLYFDDEKIKRRKVAWEGLYSHTPFGREAVWILGELPDRAEIEKELPPVTEIKLFGSADRNPEWDKIIKEQLHNLNIAALSRYQDDRVPAIDTVGVVYGYSQSIARAFGCELVPQIGYENLFFPVPGITSPGGVYNLKVKPVEESGLYANSIEFVKYAFEAVDGALYIIFPAMTGPMDTVNYLLGTTRLMEWVYEEPKALHALLRITTDYIIDVIKKIQAAANGMICSHYCVNNIFSLCSEVRSLISAETCEEFEAPYLKQIGEVCGAFTLHSCGTWDRSIQLILDNPYIRLIDFQSKEMDLNKVYRLTKGKISLSFRSSANIGDIYLWQDVVSFFRHVMGVFPEPVPLLIGFNSSDIDAYLAVQTETGGGKSGMFKWRPDA